MAFDSSALENAVKATSDSLGNAAGYLPSLLVAILLVIAGFVAGRLARHMIRRIANSFNRVLEKVFQRGALSKIRLSRGAITLVGEVAFWVIVILAIAAAAKVAGLDALSNWLGQIIQYLPNVISGAVIIVVGYAMSTIFGDSLSQAAEAADIRRSVLIGRIAQIGTLAVAIIIGLGQIGIDVTLLIALAVVIIGATLLGFSIAFGLGAQGHVRNLVSARAIRDTVKAGQTVHIGSYEGQVLEMTSTHIVLEIQGGKVLVPASLADEDGIEILVESVENVPSDV